MKLATLTSLDGMDSRDIASLTGKEHRNVCRDIVDQLGQLEGGVLRFEHTYRNEQNKQEYKCYLLPKRECLILASGYNIKLRAAIIDRWAELEAKNAPVTMSRVEFARALLAAEERAEAEAKQKEALLVELDRSKEFASIKRMESLFPGEKFNWRKLKAQGAEMGVESKEVFDANYGTVKTYRGDVWLEAYGVSIC